MMNSRLMMIMTIQAGSCPSSIRQIRAEQTRSLSASGSMNFPKFVTRLYFLAIFPSSMSVRLATMKMARQDMKRYVVFSPPWASRNQLRKTGS